MKRLTNILIIVVLGLLIIGCTSTPTTPQDTSTNTEPTPTQEAVLPTEPVTVPTDPIEVTPIPTEVPTSIPSPTELPTPTATNTPSPTPLPTSTPTPTVAPTATPIPVESSLYEYEIQRGENVWYRFTEDTLYVTGTGKVAKWENYGYMSKDVELRKRLSDIKIIIVEEGITEIGEFSFSNADNLEEIHLPSTVTSIKGNAFSFCGLNDYERVIIITGLDKNRIEIIPGAFSFTNIGDDELYALPTPTPTPSPIPAPKAEEVDVNNPKIIANVQMGDNVWFEFYDTGELYVKGSGKTWDFPYGFDWTDDYLRNKYPHIPVFTREYAANVKTCYVGDEVTYLGNLIFWGLRFEKIYASANTTYTDCGIGHLKITIKE